MGQKANPIGLRLGIIRGWESNWYGGKNYADKILEDDKIRRFLAKRFPTGNISRVIIERTLKRITINIFTSKPGIIIGKGASEVNKTIADLKTLTKKDITVQVTEIRRPETDAHLVAENIAKQLEARMPFRRAMKMSILNTMRSGADGIKIICSGRLGGAEIARTEQYKDGRVPLHTLRADIDYALVEAQTVYGKIGIKCWVCRGEKYGKQDLSPAAQALAISGGPGGGGGRDDRRGGGRDDRRGGPGGDRRGPGGPGGDRGPRGPGGPGGPGGDRGGFGGGGRGPGGPGQGGPGGDRGGFGGGNRGPGQGGGGYQGGQGGGGGYQGGNRGPGQGGPGQGGGGYQGGQGGQGGGGYQGGNRGPGQGGQGGGGGYQGGGQGGNRGPGQGGQGGGQGGPRPGGPGPGAPRNDNTGPRPA